MRRVSPADRKAAAARLTAIPLLVMRAVMDLMRDPSNRDWIRLRLSRPKGLFQPFNDTAANRYPSIFRFIQSELGGESACRILSFGCSTGEEAFSLRRYFPRAAIKGIDINPRNVALARRRLRANEDSALTFDVAASTSAEPSDAYDAIFCMATLRHGDLKSPGVTRCDHRIRFDDFARVVADFERCLKPGGILVIVHSNFRFVDTPAAARFALILRADDAEAGFWDSPIFGRDNRLIEGVACLDLAFRKEPTPSDLRAPTLQDVVSSPAISR